MARENDRFMLRRALRETSFSDRLHAGGDLEFLEKMGAHFEELEISGRSSPTPSQSSNSTMSLRSHPQRLTIPFMTMTSILEGVEQRRAATRTDSGSFGSAPFQPPSASTSGSNNGSTRAQCPTNSQASTIVVSNSELIGESTTSTHSSMPSLTGESSSSSSSSSSSPSSIATIEGIEDLPTHIRHLDPTMGDDDVPEITNRPPTNIVFERPERKPLECPLWFLNNCGCEEFTTLRELYHHTVMRHLWYGEQGRTIFPQEVRCPLKDCQRLFKTAAAKPDFAWKALLKHIAKHHRSGRTLEDSVLHNEFLDFLWRSKLINTPQFQDLVQNGQLTQPFNHYVEYHNEERWRRRDDPRSRRRGLPPSRRYG